MPWVRDPVNKNIGINGNSGSTFPSLTSFWFSSSFPSNISAFEWPLCDCPWFEGLISALRSFSEFTAAPILASWSDRLGRKWALLLSSVAFVLEAGLIAVPRCLPKDAESELPGGNSQVSPGLMMMGIVHTLGGFLASNGAIETSCVAVGS